MRDLPFILCLVIYSFSPLLMWTHGYLFHTLGFNPLLLYLCSCPNFFSFGQRCSCVSLTYFYFVFFVFFFLSTYLLSSTTRYPKLIFYFPHWSTRISYVSKLPPQRLVPFIWECCQKPSDRYAHCFWVSFLSPLSWLSSKHTKCIRPTISVSVYHYLYEALYRLFDVSSSISLPHG